ncbi:cytochrome P450 [Mycobacterium sp. M1]|uniref:Cytochrome P450 n=1 Tax=Mycolicibacter acidiphilus TaxID=2835306 RepID=A0ABS5RQ71_9MYCO|nr:cytochrome P450 [Mycolicibacter acidiphilus]MBS9536172.1 cytochrome P450 [Mycolicibacter acidiphilus]
MSQILSGHPVAPPVRLPPTPRLPVIVQGLAFALWRRRFVESMSRRHGGAVTLNIPFVGPLIVVTDPLLAKKVFTASPDDLGNVRPNLSELLGSGSMLGLEGSTHRQRRRLVAPAFHGAHVESYVRIIEDETLHEIAAWPEGRPFATLPAMKRITLNVVLRTFLGGADSDLDEMRDVVPAFVSLASRLVTLPIPARTMGRHSPWGRLAELRRRYDACLDRIIATAQADPGFANRSDVLSRLVTSRYEDGSAMSRAEIGDEMLTLLAAGHESTAATLSWAFERLSRHPVILAAMVDEVATHGHELRRAVIREVQRCRTVVQMVGRRVVAPTVQVGDWVIPRGTSIGVGIAQIHTDPASYPDPNRFDPQRFLGVKPPTDRWMPYGGGARRCIGASFAELEMDVVLCTVLRHCTVETTGAADEKVRARGIAFTPRDGGRVTIRHRPKSPV